MRKIIRIFISSTFLQFDKERNVLVGKVFPKLRERCREKGFSFRAVDLRWGITENQGKKHQAAGICFEEIQRCIEYSPKPNFIVLSEDYYGWVPSPSLISQDCWGRIREELSHTNPDGLKYLEKWYRKDLNDLAGSMILQEVSAEEGGTAFTQDV